MKYHIYIITNTINAKQYVGITKNLNRRWKEHKSTQGGCVALYEAISKYGVENFVFTHIADAFNFESACDIERILIVQHNTKAPNGYNLTDGGDGVSGVYRSEEVKKRMSDAQKGKKGKPHTDEFKKSLSDRVSGEKNPMFGKTGSKNPNYGKKYSDERRKNISNALKGHKSPNKGKKISDEQRAKFAATIALRKIMKQATVLDT